MQIMESKSTAEGDGQESNSVSSDHESNTKCAIDESTCANYNSNKENEDCSSQSNIQSSDELTEKDNKNKTVITNNNEEEKEVESTKDDNLDEIKETDAKESESEEKISDDKSPEKVEDEINDKTEKQAEENEAVASTSEELVASEQTNQDSPTDSQQSIDEEVVEADKEASGGAGEEDEEMDVDLDPTLLCPEVTMEEDENQQIVPNNDASLNDGSTSPELYQPLFSTLVDEITGAELSFDLTPDEIELQKRTYGPDNPIEKQKIHCTACNTHLGSALAGQSNRFVHPMLKVLVCRECYHFYTSGEFEKDEDGSELYCRWCGQGGSVLCCASCEFVFCKKCIRNNFGKRRLNHIKNSDDWKCFRCEPKVLEPIRVACFEFFQYIKRAMAEAQVTTDPDFISTDHTTCCNPKLKEEQQAKRKRRRAGSIDPDYNPFAENRSDEEPPAKKTATTDNDVKPVVNKLPEAKPGIPQQIVGRFQPITSQLMSSLPPGSYIATSAPTGSQGNSILQKQLLSFKIGTTNFKRVAIMNPTSLSTTPSTFPQPIIRMVSPLTMQSRMTRPPVPGTQTVRHVPYVVQQRATYPPPGAQQQYRVAPPPLARVNRARVPVIKATLANSPPGTANNNIVLNPIVANRGYNSNKQEWFAKTVAATARVNSDLSYTLSVLNKQKASANTVEKLAIIHNKLQEVLSTSINSLIQIRKNLRTDFISDIKNYRPPAPAPPLAVLPPAKPACNEPITLDDDVVFVNANNDPIASTSTQKSGSSTPMPIITSAVSLSPKKSTILNPLATASNAPKPSGGYLRVKSFSALQTVTSECITIPDDFTPKSSESTISASSDSVDVKSNESKTDSKDSKTDDKDSKTDDKESKTDDKDSKKDSESSIIPAECLEINDTSLLEENEDDSEKLDKMDDDYRYLLYNVSEEPSDLVKKILNAKVVLKRSRKIDKMCLKKLKRSHKKINVKQESI